MIMMIAYGIAGLPIGLVIGMAMYEERWPMYITMITSLVAWFVWPMVALAGIVSSLVKP